MDKDKIQSNEADTIEAIETSPVVATDPPVDQGSENQIEDPSISRRQSTFVAPIRSFSIRQPSYRPSSSDLRRDHGTPPRPPRRVSSATISNTIEKLQDLLDQAEDIAYMTEAQQASRAADLESGVYSRPSAIVSKHKGNTSDDAAQAHDRKSPPPRRQRRIKFAEGCIPEEGPWQAEPASTTKSLLAYDPAHQSNYKTKSALSPPAIAEDFELKPMIPRRSRRPNFVSSTGRESLSTARPLTNQAQSPTRPLKPDRNHLTRQDVGEDGLGADTSKAGPRPIPLNTASSTDPRRRTIYSGLPPALKTMSPQPMHDIRTCQMRECSGCSEEFKDEDLTATDAGPSDFHPGHERHFTQMFGVGSRQVSIDFAHAPQRQTTVIGLKGLRHVDIHNKPDDFDLHTSCHHAPIARNWPPSRKRFAATIACVNTACIGLLIGIYAGEVPAIQYVIVDFHHYTILGNVFMYCGLVVPTLLLWPLPLLHGRKSYTVGSLALALCLQIPQGVAVSNFRTPYVRTYRVLLLLSRAVSGFVLGFCSMNSFAALLDLFGASLQSQNPHQEIVDPYDVRRHGGGMGVWLGIWSWCSIGSISIGFCIGAFIISGAPVSWGFWTAALLLMGVLLLNVIAPELRRSAFRRTITEFQADSGEFSRVARGEVKMHLKGTGPFWWGEEIKAGVELCWLMTKQPGFLVLAGYAAWVYAQFTMVLMFLGALTSTYYRFRAVLVGTCVLCMGLGALAATPFQKASWLSRARYRPPRTDSMTLQGKFTWSSHLVRRALFTILLPLAAISYTLTSKGPPFPPAVPCVFAAAVGFCTNLALAECYGLIMENFDTSDLQPGMTGRPARKSIVDRFISQRTNFSCYPRVSAGVAVAQSLQYTIAAAATGVCGRLERRYGAMLATAIVAGVLLALTAFLTVILYRGKSVRMIRNNESVSTLDEWEPVVLGQPSGTMRRISILEAGRQSRWSEIRRRNRLDPSLRGS